MSSKISQKTTMSNLVVGDRTFEAPTRLTEVATLPDSKLSQGVQIAEINFSADVVTVTDTGGVSGGHGTQKLFDFPARRILVLAASSDLAVTAAAGISATGTVKWAIGTASETTNDTLDSTQADVVASTNAVLTASAGNADGGSATAQVGVALAPSGALYLNFGVADADITSSSSVTLTGTVRVAYIDVGAK